MGLRYNTQWWLKRYTASHGVEIIVGAIKNIDI
jgi:hypothetical protein